MPKNANPKKEIKTLPNAIGNFKPNLVLKYDEKNIKNGITNIILSGLAVIAIIRKNKANVKLIRLLDRIMK